LLLAAGGLILQVVNKALGCSINMLSSNFVQCTPYSKFQSKLLELNEAYFFGAVWAPIHIST
jgi:hypothetical protein